MYNLNANRALVSGLFCMLSYDMAILGAHMSIAGGFYKAVDAAAACGCDCVQLFTKNANQWRAKNITPQDVERFHASLEKTGVGYPIAHDSYLINLASPDDVLWQKSIDALENELRRAAMLGIPYVVTHPGAYTTSTEEEGLQRIIGGLDTIGSRLEGCNARCLLETTAGQGTSLGARFEHFATILDGVKDPDRLGICLDTCHIFAAGYPMETKQQYNATFRALDRTVGLGQIKAFHLNDSRRELGSRVDRHARIGQGEMGIAPFRHLLNDERFAETPMYLETPKGEEDGVALDILNLQTLRDLIK